MFLFLKKKIILIELSIYVKSIFFGFLACLLVSIKILLVGLFFFNFNL